MKIRYRLWLAIFLMVSCCLLWLTGCQSPPTSGLRAKVQRVVSGQTLDVLISSTQSPLITRVRLVGISAPDLQQYPWGIAAKKKLQELLSQQKVLLESATTQKDAFGRQLAYLWHNNTLVNEQLVAEGLVLADIDSFNRKYRQRLIRAQEYARAMGYGIWNPQQPMRLTPQEFRLQHPNYEGRVQKEEAVVIRKFRSST